MTTTQAQGRIDYQGSQFHVSFAYDAALVAAVKRLPGRRWDAGARVWTLPRTAALNLERFAQRYGFAVSETAEAVMVQAEESQAASRAMSGAIEVPGLGKTLRPFQRAGVEYIVAHQGRVLVADQMGLGKTLEALASFVALGARRLLAVVPANLRGNWLREAAETLPGRRAYVLRTSVDAVPEWAELVIVSYELAVKRRAELVALGCDMLVCDESHYLKEGKSQRTRAITGYTPTGKPRQVGLAEGCRYRLLLSGTPMKNRPVELCSQLEILGLLGHFGGFWSFCERYVGPVQTRFGWDFSGAKNLGELNAKLREVGYLRREKAEVLTELPAKQRTLLPVELAAKERREYQRAEADLVGWLRAHAAAFGRDADEAEERALRAEWLVRINTLRQLVAQMKLGAAVEQAKQIMASGEQVVVVAWHRAIVERIAVELGAPTIYGGQGDAAIEQAKASFQAGQSPAIVINMQAGGMGHTLTAASQEVVVEFGWTPTDQDQAEDRIHRIGQEATSVNYWYLYAPGTIDERIHALVESKRRLVETATGGGRNVKASEVSVQEELRQMLLREEV